MNPGIPWNSMESHENQWKCVISGIPYSYSWLETLRCHLLTIFHSFQDFDEMEDMAIWDGHILHSMGILDSGGNSANPMKSSISLCQIKAPPLVPSKSWISIHCHGFPLFLRCDQSMISQESDLPGGARF